MFIGFIARYWKLISLALAIISLLGALWYYGHTKYREGWDECTVAQEKAQNEAVTNTIKEKDKINVKEQNLDDNGIDAGLAGLGIVRRTEDR